MRKLLKVVFSLGAVLALLFHFGVVQPKNEALACSGGGGECDGGGTGITCPPIGIDYGCCHELDTYDTYHPVYGESWCYNCKWTGYATDYCDEYLVNACQTY
jgi:hypothetical protein